MGRVFARISGLGPREKLCVPSTWAAFEGCDVGNRVKLDWAGDVARRWGIGGGAGALRKPYLWVSMENHLGEDHTRHTFASGT